MRRLRLLGPVCVEQAWVDRVEAQENDVAAIPRFRSRRTVGLLGYLVIAQRPIAREALAALFWPDETPAKGRANLSRELHNLSRILPGCWQVDRQTAAFIPAGNIIVDLYQLRELVAKERWREASDLLGGEFMEGHYLEDNAAFENWLLAERENWRESSQTIFARVIEGDMRRGHYDEAIDYAHHLLQIAPWDENAHRQMMRLWAWTGKHGAALRQFERCRAALREELDIEPSAETIALYRQILAGDLAVPPPLPAFLSGETARFSFEQPPFVVRENEIARLDAFMAAALAGQGQMAFVTGGPGQGKTALLGAFAQRAMAMHPGLLVAAGRCHAYSGLGDPYVPYRDIMAMLTGDVQGKWDAGAITRDHAWRLWSAFPFVVQAILDHGPNLLDVLVPGAPLLSRSKTAEQDQAPWLARLREQVEHTGTDTKEMQQSDLFQQIIKVLHVTARDRPLLLTLDDIQWADAASISLLFHLGRSLAEANTKLLILCTYRPEEVAIDRNGEPHPLAKVVNEFKRAFGDVWLDLDRIEKAEERRFVDALLDSEPNRLGKEFRTALFERTAGHPLFTVELLRALRERRDLRRDTDGAWIESSSLNWQVLPARTEAVIAARIEQLAPQLRDILTIASVEGELFTAQVIAAVQKVPVRSLLQRLTQDLDRQLRLVREQEEVTTGRRWLHRYRFQHILFQDYLLNRLSLGECRLLHGEIAVALEALYDGQTGDIAVELAHHFHQAGDYGPAFHYYSAAAERDVGLFENREAIKHYTSAIRLAENVSPDTLSLAKLHRGRGLAYERVGEFDRAHVDHTSILQIARDLEEQQPVWRAYLDLGRLWSSRDYYQAKEYFESALALARRLGKPPLLADSLNWMGNWHANNDNPAKAIIYHQETLLILEELTNRKDLANTFDLLAIANLLSGNISGSIHHYNQAIELFRELDDRRRLVSSLIGRATTISALAWLAAVPPGSPPDAPADFAEALQIADEIGSLPNQAWAHYSLGMLHTVRGEFSHALREVQNGLHTASEIGHREYIVGSRFALGVLYAELFALDLAREQFAIALTLAEELSSPTWIHITASALARVYLQQDDLERARTYLEKVIDRETAMDSLGRRYGWVVRAEIALTEGNPDEALDITERLIRSVPGKSPGQVVTHLWKLKAETLAANGRLEEACCLLDAAVRNARSSGEYFLLWRLHASLGSIHETMGCMEDAGTAFETAHLLIEELAAAIPERGLRESFCQGSTKELRTVPNRM